MTSDEFDPLARLLELEGDFERTWFVSHSLSHPCSNLPNQVHDRVHLDHDHHYEIEDKQSEPMQEELNGNFARTSNLERERKPYVQRAMDLICQEDSSQRFSLNAQAVIQTILRV